MLAPPSHFRRAGLRRIPATAAALALLFAGRSVVAREAAVASQVSALYQPLRVEQATLSPDGRHVAFAVRERGDLELQVFAVGQTGMKTRVALDGSRTAELRFLAWFSPARVVAATSAPSIFAVDADGSNPRVLAEARTFAAHDARQRRGVRVRGIADEEPDSVIVEVMEAEPGAGPRLELFRVNVRTDARQPVDKIALESGDNSLIFDRQGRPRILVSRSSIPQRFMHRPVTGGGSWQPLDRVAREVPALAFHVSPENLLGARSIPLGFAHEPEILYFASNIGRDTHGIYALDLRTGRRTGFALEDSGRDLVSLHEPWLNSPLVIDRSRRSLVGVRGTGRMPRTRWLDPEIAAVQTALEKKFPNREVELLEWDDARAHFLALIASPGDPGRYFVHDRADGRCVEYLRRASAPARAALNPVEPFVFNTPAGVRISGSITRPHAPPVARPALAIWLQDGPWRGAGSELDRDAQALAAMGFVVAQIDYRGTGGFGRAQRDALRRDPEAGPIEDVLAMLVWLEGRHAFDHRRVALVGEDFGGYLALRAVQRNPDAFRCAVSINGPVKLEDLRYSQSVSERARREFERDALTFRPRIPTGEGEEGQTSGNAGGGAGMALEAPQEPLDFDRAFFRWYFAGARASSVPGDADSLMRPVMLLHEAGHRYAPIEAVKKLHATLERKKRAAVLAEIPPQFARAGPAARSQVVRRIGEFLNVNLYDFDVKIGGATEKK